MAIVDVGAGVLVGVEVGTSRGVGVGTMVCPRLIITLCVLWLYWRCMNHVSGVLVVV